MAEIDRSFDRQTILQFWRASLLYKRDLFLVLIYLVGTIALNTIIPLYVGKILASLARPMVSLKPLLIGFVIAAVVGLTCNRYGMVALMGFQARVTFYLQKKVMETLLKRSIGFHNNNVSGKLVSDAIDYPNAFVELTTTVFVNMLPFVITLVSGLIIITFASPLLGAIVGVMAIFTITSSWIDSRRRLKMRLRRIAATKKVTAHLADTIVNVQTVKAFAREDTELAESNRLNKILRGMRIHDWILSATKGNNRMMGLMALQLIYIYY